MNNELLKNSPLGQKIIDGGNAELFTIERDKSRQSLAHPDIAQKLTGDDLWRLHELSWLQPNGIPTFHCGEFIVPAQSENIIESKSLKLYCNSLNQKTFSSAKQFCQTVARDISAALKTPVSLRLFPQHLADNIQPNSDFQDLDILEITPQDKLENTGQKTVNAAWRSNLLRSNCPVTGAPDWASLAIKYRGHEINPAALLRLIISLRDSQGFHEYCLEKLFCEIWETCKPEMLHIQAFYTRRGGIDINPWRSLVR